MRRPRACRGGSCGGAPCTTSPASKGRSGSRPNGGAQPSTARLRDYYRVEDAERPPLLDLPRRRDRRRPRRRAQLVHPRAFRLMPAQERLFTNEAGPDQRHAASADRRRRLTSSLGVSSALLFPARRVGRDRVGADGASSSAMTRSALPTATRWRASCGCTAPATMQDCGR